MEWWAWCIIGIAILIGVGLWTICAANHYDDRDDQIEWLHKEYLRQKRKHEITFKEQRGR